jgi:hypothetical protein
MVSDLARQAALDALYRELPTLDCQRQCQDCCGPIAMSRVEWQRICRKLGHVPRGADDLVCPMLQQGLCSVYHIRPVICRLWGVTETLPCPWGCQPQPRYLTHEEGLVYCARADYISDPEHAMPPEEFERLLASHPDRLAMSRLFVQQPGAVRRPTYKEE